MKQATHLRPMDGLTTLDGEPHFCISDVDRLAPFLMNVVSNGNLWSFVGSNTAITAGRRNPDGALFPYQTADKLLSLPQASGVKCLLRVGAALWEPWSASPRPAECSRHLYKHECGTSVVFEETNPGLGLRLRWRLGASEEFGLVRHCLLENVGSSRVEVQSLDGWHQLLPSGVTQETYARFSYLAAAYMRHELLASVGLGVYTLNAAISDRTEPAEVLRAACAWSLGHRQPVRLLSARQVPAFRATGAVREETEIRGDFGAYLVADEFALSPGEVHEWFVVADTGLDHRALVDLRHRLAAPEELRSALRESLAANTRGLRHRVAAADGLQQTADRTACAHHFSNVLFNLMRGGTLDHGYCCPRSDFAAFLKTRNTAVHARHRDWLDSLPQELALPTLPEQAAQRGDHQLTRLASEYLPLCFSRRHGDPSRPWNRFSIETQDAAGRPLLGYSGNWRDIFQNWEALAQSHPACLGPMIAVFLNASTADGYNPYRITRDGIDWEVHDPSDPWSHIGYWGDHQIIYLLRLLEAHERFWPGELTAAMDNPAYTCAVVPYEIAGFDALVADPRHSISFNHTLHLQLLARSAELGADGKLLAGADGEPRLVSLAEKLLVPALVKLSNLVPGGGIWLNTQRPEWNDANNALAGWGLSVVTVCHLRRYLVFVDRLLAPLDDSLGFTEPVAGLMAALKAALKDWARDTLDDDGLYALFESLGRAGEAHRRAVYAGGSEARCRVPVAEVRALLASARSIIEETIRSNRLEDGLYHSYNVLDLSRGRVTVKRLPLMLEGQVAVLSSEMLADEGALALLEALPHSPLHRADQRSYLLYPDREIAPFLTRNTLPANWRQTAPCLAAMVAAGENGVIVLDRKGDAHFQADLTNAGDLVRRLDALAVTPADQAGVLGLWEEVFHHGAFTGRSGTFFAFEGLGSIYWHMVAKLLIAVQECHSRAGDAAQRARLREAYARVRDGLGFRKTPEEYGAFPTDAYSHTPRHAGAQQPGMTGQVKEEVLTRLGEFVVVADGRLAIAPRLADASEFGEADGVFNYVDVAGKEAQVPLPPRSLAFTFCQVPVVLCLGAEPGIVVRRADGRATTIPGATLPAELSRDLFLRTGTIASLTATITASQLT